MTGQEGGAMPNAGGLLKQPRPQNRGLRCVGQKGADWETLVQGTRWVDQEWLERGFWGCKNSCGIPSYLANPLHLGGEQSRLWHSDGQGAGQEGEALGATKKKTGIKSTLAVKESTNTGLEGLKVLG